MSRRAAAATFAAFLPFGAKPEFLPDNHKNGEDRRDSFSCNAAMINGIAAPGE
jgi:hypothetical protein